MAKHDSTARSDDQTNADTSPAESSASESASGNYGLAELLSRGFSKELEFDLDADGALRATGSLDELHKIKANAEEAIAGISNGISGIGRLLSAYDRDTGGIEHASFEIGWLLIELGGALTQIDNLRACAQDRIEMKESHAAKVGRASAPTTVAARSPAAVAH